MPDRVRPPGRVAVGGVFPGGSFRTDRRREISNSTDAEPYRLPDPARTGQNTRALGEPRRGGKSAPPPRLPYPAAMGYTGRRQSRGARVSTQANSLRSIFYALGANLAVALAKLLAAIHTGSSSMLAEAIHSFADCGNQGLLLLGLKQADRPATDEHPLGYGMAIYFWSFIVALMLFSMGGLFSIYEGLHKLHETRTMSSPWLAIAILLFSMIAEGISLRGCLREIDKVRNGRSLWRWFRDTRQSELIVVLGEDTAALIGLSLALAAILATIISGNPVYDAWGSIAIGALLVLVAIGIGIEVHGLMIGQSVEEDVRREILTSLEQRGEIDAVLNLITLQLGKDVMVAVKARMHDYQRPDEMIAAINRCEAALKDRLPQLRWVFFEPDNRL